MKVIRVAIVGTAGTGKSFLVNSILGNSAVKHEVSAGPVTLESSCHRAVISVEGEDAVLELVDTPGLCGQGEVRRTVQEDLITFNSKFHTLDKVVVVIRGGRQRFETSERKEIKNILEFVDYKNNPENVLFLMNDGRQKNISEKQKEMELNAALRMLGIEDYEICKPGRNVTQNRKVSLAVAVSNCEDANFNDEINYVRSVLNKKNTIKSIVPSAKKEGIHMANILICVGILLLLFIFSYKYISYNYVIQLDLVKKSFEEDCVKLKEDEDIVTSKIRKVAEKKKNLSISVSELEVKFNELLDENTNLNNKKTNLTSNIEQLIKNNKDLTNSISEDDRKFNTLKEENTNLKDRETALKSNIEQTDNENKNMKKSAIEDERKFNDLKEENTKLKDTETALKSNIEQTDNENKNMKKSAIEDETKFNDLKEENKKLKDTETALKSNIEATDNENKNMKKFAIEDERKFNDLKEENTKLKNTEKALKSNIEQTDNENKNMKKSAIDDERKFNNLKEENTNLKDTETALKSNIEQTDNENKNMKKSAIEDERKFNDLKEENTKLKDTESALKSIIEQTDNENENMKKSAIEDERKFNDIKEENTKLKDNETALKSNIEQTDNENKNMKKSAIEDERKFNDLKEDNINLKNKENIIQSEISNFEKENESLKESVHKNETKLKEKREEFCQEHLQCESSWALLSFKIIIGISLIFCFSFYTLKKQDLSDNHQKETIYGLEWISEDEDDEEFTQDQNYKNTCKKNTNVKDKGTNVKSNIKKLRKENKDPTQSVSENKTKFIVLKEENTNLRDREHSERQEALQALTNTLDSSAVFLEKGRNLTGEGDDGYSKEKELDVLAKKIAEVAKWRDDKIEEQKATPLSEMPKLTVNMIISKITDLDSEVKFLVNTAKTRKAEKEREKRKKEAEEKKAEEEAKNKAKRS